MTTILEIVRINRKHGGSLINKSSLDFAVDKANREENIWKSNAHLVRGIIVNHAFLDGNKSTASEIILKRFARKNIRCNKTLFSRGIIDIAKKNEGNINKITRRLKKWCIKR